MERLAKLKLLVLNQKAIVSFLLFLLVALSQFILDYSLTKILDEQMLGDWAYFRSFFLFGPVFLLLGVQDVIVRNKIKLVDIFSIIFIQVFVLGAILSLIGFLFLQIELPLWVLFFSTVLFAFTQLVYRYLQSEKKFVLSQIAFGGWRIVLLVLLLVASYFALFEISVFNISLFLILSFLLVSVYVLNFEHKNIISIEKIRKISREDFIESKQIYILGGIFYASSLTLYTANYFDQLVLGLFNVGDGLALYFTHLTILLTPFLLVNKFMGFITLPYVRGLKDKEIGKKFFFTYLLSYIFIVLVISVFLLLIGRVVFNYLYSGAYEYSYTLGALIAAQGGLRLIYLIPSSFMAMLASGKHLVRGFLGVNILGAISQFGVIAIFHFLDLDIVAAVAISVVTNWSIRALLGINEVRKLELFAK